MGFSNAFGIPSSSYRGSFRSVGVTLPRGRDEVFGLYKSTILKVQRVPMRIGGGGIRMEGHISLQGSRRYWRR